MVAKRYGSFLNFNGVEPIAASFSFSSELNSSFSVKCVIGKGITETSVAIA